MVPAEMREVDITLYTLLGPVQGLSSLMVVCLAGGGGKSTCCASGGQTRAYRPPVWGKRLFHVSRALLRHVGDFGMSE